MVKDKDTVMSIRHACALHYARTQELIDHAHKDADLMLKDVGFDLVEVKKTIFRRIRYKVKKFLRKIVVSIGKLEKHLR